MVRSDQYGGVTDEGKDLTDKIVRVGGTQDSEAPPILRIPRGVEVQDVGDKLAGEIDLGTETGSRSVVMDVCLDRHSCKVASREQRHRGSIGDRKSTRLNSSHQII